MSSYRHEEVDGIKLRIDQRSFPGYGREGEWSLDKKVEWVREQVPDLKKRIVFDTVLICSYSVLFVQGEQRLVGWLDEQYRHPAHDEILPFVVIGRERS